MPLYSTTAKTKCRAHPAAIYSNELCTSFNHSAGQPRRTNGATAAAAVAVAVGAAAPNGVLGASVAKINIISRKFDSGVGGRWRAF